MRVNHLIGIIMAVFVTCLFSWVTFYPAEASTNNVDVKQTAYLLGTTSIAIFDNTIGVKMISFSDGTICVFAAKRESSSGVVMQCYFSNSSTVNTQP